MMHGIGAILQTRYSLQDTSAHTTCRRASNGALVIAP